MSKIFLKCKDIKCEVNGGREFFWSDSEQEFYKKQGYNQPKRCFTCRNNRKNIESSPFAEAYKNTHDHSDKEFVSN